MIGHQQALADAAKCPLVWKAIARQMGPQALRMNLNTLPRHAVFKNGNGPDNVMIDYVASRIADADAITRSRQFRYGHSGSTGVMTQWQEFIANQRRHGITDPKLVCIDIQPYRSSQASHRSSASMRATNI